MFLRAFTADSPQCPSCGEMAPIPYLQNRVPAHIREYVEKDHEIVCQHCGVVFAAKIARWL